MTLGDEEARRRGTQKTVLERKAPPTFDTLVEIRTRDEFAVFHETAPVVDAFLRGRSMGPQVRVRKDGGFDVRDTEAPRFTSTAPRSSTRREPPKTRKTIRIYPYGISKDRLDACD